MRRVRVEVLAHGGFCLEQSILEIKRMTQRPDAILKSLIIAHQAMEVVRFNGFEIAVQTKAIGG